MLKVKIRTWIQNKDKEIENSKLPAHSSYEDSEEDSPKSKSSIGPSESGDDNDQSESDSSTPDSESEN